MLSIDQAAFDNLDLLWPWLHTLHADLIPRLMAHHATFTAVDLLSTEPKVDPDTRHDVLLSHTYPLRRAVDYD
jgi:CHASE2 domain-containing sensor protein